MSSTSNVSICDFFFLCVFQDRAKRIKKKLNELTKFEALIGNAEFVLEKFKVSIYYRKKANLYGEFSNVFASFSSLFYFPFFFLLPPPPLYSFPLHSPLPATLLSSPLVSRCRKRINFPLNFFKDLEVKKNFFFSLTKRLKPKRLSQGGGVRGRHAVLQGRRRRTLSTSVYPINNFLSSLSFTSDRKF